jgi:hypothetical protein
MEEKCVLAYTPYGVADNFTSKVTIVGQPASKSKANKLRDYFAQK